LFADQQYFGLDARALRAGAERVLARVAAQPSNQARIDVRGVGEDYHLDGAASWTLIREFLAGGLLYPDGTAGYRLTRRFREYALACVVTPLSRARAKGLIDTTCELAARINAAWARNPFQIEMIAVSGGYMSRRNSLQELSLWVVPRSRPEARARGWRPSLSKGDALRQILSTMNALSSFIVVRIVADRQGIHRPFSVVFQASEDTTERPIPALDRVCDWGTSIARRLTSLR
jgi:hypothetical protein